MGQERDFKGIWIPKEIWLDEDLTILEKVILMEIDSLDSGDEGCYASNSYLASFCQCSENKVSTAISKLIKLGYLIEVYFDGRRRFLKSAFVFEKSSLFKNKSQPFKIKKAGFEKIKDINIINNIDNNIKRKVFKKPSIEEIDLYIKEKNMNIDARTFYDYFEANDWSDSKGNKVKSWKQKLIIWNSYRGNKQQVQAPSWLNKQQEIEIVSDDELKELEREMKVYE